jgi:hypothetical protein
MRASLTSRGYVHLLTFLFCCLSIFSATAQCPDVKAIISNGPLLNLCSGASYTLNAETKADYTSYRWQKQTTASGMFDDIAGAITSTYATDIIGAYRVIIGNGTCFDTSSITSIATLNLSGGNITGGIGASNTTICADSYVGSLSGPSVIGDELGIIKYQWQMKEGDGNYNDIPGATGLEYKAGFIKRTSSFRRAVSDNCGNITYSNEITFVTYALITPGSLQPGLQTIQASTAPSTITSAVDPTGSGTFSYRWQASLAINGPWTTIAGATSSTYTPAPLEITTYFRRITYNTECSYSATTEPVLVVVLDPVILNPGVLYSDNACLFLGNTPYPIGTKVKPAGGIKPYLIEWEYKTASGDWALIDGVHGDKLYPGPITESTNYRKKVTDAKGAIAYTEPVLLSVISTPLIPGEISAIANVACLGSSPTKIVSVKSGSNYGERGTYQWQVKTGTGPWTIIPGERKGDYQPLPITEKSIFRRVFYDSCGPNGRVAYSNEVEIDTKPALFAGDINPSTQSVMPGKIPTQLASNEAPHGGTNSYTLWWEKSDFAVGPWTKVAGATSESYQPPVAIKTTYYRRVVKDNNCLAEKFTFIIEVFVPVYPPVVSGVLSSSTCVFPGNTPANITTGSVAVSGGLAPYNFQWEYRTGTGPFTLIPGATNEQYQPTEITQTTQYRRSVTDALGTQNYSDTFTVQLITTPLVPGKIAASNESVCAGSDPGIIKSVQDASGSGGHYQWQQRIEIGTYTNIQGANASEYTLGSLTQNMYFRRVFIDECSGVKRVGYSNEVLIKSGTAGPVLPGLIGGPVVTCDGMAPPTINSTMEASGSCSLVYQWEINDGSGWAIIPGANDPSYKPLAVAVGTKYRRKVSDGLGTFGYSNEVEVLVNPKIVAGKITKETQTLCQGVTPAEIALSPDWHYTDGRATYQWQVATSANGSWSDISGSNLPAYQPKAAGTSKYYRLKLISRSCGAEVYTNVASVIVKSGCVGLINSSSTGFSGCLPVTPVAVSYPVQACNAEYTFNWEYQRGTATEWTSTGIGTNNLMITSYYLPSDDVIKWRLKMTNTDCNSISYSNTIPVYQSICLSSNTPSVYPNPSTSGGIVIISTSDTPHKIALMTVDGKRLDFKVLSTTRGFIRLQLPSSIAAGTYILHIRNATSWWAKKLLVKNK